MHQTADNWSGFFGVGFVTEEANGFLRALLLAFIPVWTVYEGYPIADHGVAVYNVSIIDNHRRSSTNIANDTQSLGKLFPTEICSYNKNK